MNPDANTNNALAGIIQSFDNNGQQPNNDPFQQPQQQQPYYAPTPPPYQQPLPQPQQQQQPYQQPAPQQQQQGQWPQVAQQQPQQQQMPQGPQPEYPIVAPQPQAPTGVTPEQVQQIVQQFMQPQQQQQMPQGGDDWPDRPKTWGDLKKFIDNAGSAAVERYKQEQQQEAQQQQQQLDAANAAIDQAETALTNQGYLPPVMNPTDPNDPGRMARRELEAYAISLGSPNLYAVAPQLKAMHDNGYYFDYQNNKLVRRGSQTAAAQAPIAGAAPSVAGYQGGTAAPTQKELATMTIDQLTSMGMQRLQ